MTDIKIYEGVTAVTIVGIATTDDAKTVNQLFENIGKASIDLDMISLELSVNDRMNVGFTFDDNELPKLLTVIKEMQDAIPSPLINCGNVKFVIKSPEMIGIPGYSAKIFSALRSVSCIPILVTTGIDEISLLVRNSDSADVGKKLNKMYQC